MELQNNVYTLVIVAVLILLLAILKAYIRKILGRKKTTPQNAHVLKNAEVGIGAFNALIAAIVVILIVPWILYYAISGSYLRSIESFLIITVMLFVLMLLFVEAKRAP